MSAQIQFQATAPPLRIDEVGGIRIGQSRVTLDSLLAAYHAGSTPEEISVQYSVLELSDIYATIAYYLSNRSQLDSYLEKRRQESEHRRMQLAQTNNLNDLRSRLISRRQAQVGE